MQEVSEEVIQGELVVVSPEIVIEHVDDGLNILSAKDYAVHYTEGRYDIAEPNRTTERNSRIKAVAKEIVTNPSATFDFDLVAKRTKGPRALTDLWISTKGYFAALADEVFELGYNLHVVIERDGKKYELGRMGTKDEFKKVLLMPAISNKFWDRLADDSDKETLYLFVQSKPLSELVSDDPKSTNLRRDGVQGYHMHATRVANDPMKAA